jgi:hypothetical protein
VDQRLWLSERRQAGRRGKAVEVDRARILCLHNRSVGRRQALCDQETGSGALCVALSLSATAPR